MKVLVLNGSPRVDGNTYSAIAEAEKVFKEKGVETEIINVGASPVRGCVACGYCAEHKKCAFNDGGVNEAAEKLKAADGLIIASPVYYASANGTLISFLDRLFYSINCDLTMKAGASIAVCRRGGGSATVDQLNKYFSISGMPIVGSQYWNIVYGGAKGEATLDGEGMQTIRTLAENFVFLMKSIKLGKEKYGLPEKEKRIRTNFIR